MRRCINCRTLINTGSRCANCQPARRKNGYAWRRVRNAVVQRDGHRCTECGHTAQLEVHHLVPLSRGGTDEPHNLVTLCRRCHLAETYR